MTTTPRRTTKASKPYTPAALFRVYDKQSGAVLGYLAPSRDGKEHYQVTCDEHGIWHCTCKAGQHGQCCCHVKAVQEICALRVALGRPGCKPAMQSDAAMQASSSKAMKSEAIDHRLITGTDALHRSRDASIVGAHRSAQEAMQRTALNGQRGFSILRRSSL